MAAEKVEGIRGWLLVYIIGSVPVLLFYAAGLSGWFFDYPAGLFIAIFHLLSIPLLLILLRSPRAPQWNIALLWGASILINLRIIYGLLQHRIEVGQPPLSKAALIEAMPILSGIVIFSLAWAMVWTKYFKTSLAVRNTFGKRR